MSDRRKILICDDDPLLIESLASHLMADGYDVATAADGQEALAKAASEAPALIVVDAMMPRLDGIEVLARVRHDAALSAIPVVVLTARRGEKDRVLALTRGAVACLVKPLVPDELLARLAKLLPRGAPDAA